MVFLIIIGALYKQTMLIMYNVHIEVAINQNLKFKRVLTIIGKDDKIRHIYIDNHLEEIKEKLMTFKLFIQAILKFALGVVLVGALIFLPAGTLAFVGGWLLMGILFIPMFIAGIVMMIFNPSLLASRLDAKEKEKEQSVVVKLSGLMFIFGFVLAGLDFRFGTLKLPFAVNIAAAVVFLLAYVLYAEVLRQNTYLSRTIKVVDGQKVISTGLYGIVRHPMYFATLLLFMSIPFVLGSLISFIVFLAYPVIISKRIKNEEEVLTRELEGYEEYKKKVKYRMLPFIW